MSECAGGQRRILFVTTQNVLTPCGELSYIRRRALELRTSWGVETQFLVISNSRHLRDPKEPISELFPADVLGVELRRPWTLPRIVRAVRSRVAREVRSGRYAAVVLSGAFTVALAPMIKQLSPQLPVVGDFHGAWEDMLRVGSGRGLAGRAMIGALYAANELATRRGMASLDGYVSVSRELNHYIRDRYDVPHAIPAFAVPSSCDPTLATPEQLSWWRRDSRHRYGFAESDIVFGYAGSTSPWQCLDQAYAMARELREGGLPIRLLLLVSDRTHLPAGAAHEPWVSVDSVPSDVVEATLCAADYLFLLRDDSVVARVAFPTKFLEYLKTGAWVVTTPFAGEVADVVAEEGLGIVTEFDTDTVRRHVMSGADSRDPALRERRARVLADYSMARTLAPVVERFHR